MIRKARCSNPMIPICSTCLSRDRVLLPLPTHKCLVKYFQDIKLSESDYVCWECRAIINKMILFRDKAIKAQGVLKEMIRKKQYTINNIQCLSDLKECYEMPEGSVIIGVQLDEDDVMNEVKTEENQENFLQNDEVEVEIGILQNCSDNKELEESENIFESDNIDGQSDCEDNFFENDSNRDTTSDFKANTKKSSSSRRRNRRKAETENEESDEEALPPPPAKKKSKIKDDASSDEDYVGECNNSSKVKKKVKEAPKKPENYVKYRLKKMSEEEMLQARERKRDSEMFQNSRYKCDKCIEIFESKKALDYHMLNHNEFLGVISCDICELRFNFKNAHRMHVAEHYRCYSCFECEWECEGLEEMMKHHETQHDFKEWLCHFCNRQFLTQGAFKLHSKMLHQNECVCPLCGKTLTTHSRVLLHIQNNHYGQAECPICHKSVVGKNLKLHMKYHEQNEQEPDEAAYCVECNIQFKSLYRFERHLKTGKHVANDDRPFPCPHCDMRFNARTFLRYHFEAKHTEDYKYSCKICKKKFKTDKRMAVHVREKHEGKVRPRDKLCDMCGRGFRERRTLIHHIRTHTGERPFECNYCNARFAQSIAMLTHKRNQHERDRDGKM